MLRLPMSGPSITVLLVDDHEDIRELMALQLKYAGEGLVLGGSVASGEAALEVIDEIDPTVVVLDEMMPGMTGVETAMAIRARRPGQLMVLFSAFLNADVRDRAERAGIAMCVPKADILKLPSILLDLAAR